MSWLVFGFGLFIAALSVYGLLQPRKLMSMVTNTVSKPWGMAFAIAVRLALGTLFLLAAPQVSQPVFIEILGWLMIAAAAAIALMGRQRMIRFTDYWAAKTDAAIRAWLVMGVLFGVAVAWAA
ncbi:MAG: hypothetical protein HKO64_03975 [Xanthomonadales bacterium]|nr:hypothetical protein [Gammaproteobacteria bacterium]NNL94757.1 hypothetical protein [Xanthomonadales bacterium]